jgi:hypothetical protein
VDNNHTHFTAEVRGPDGSSLSQFHLLPKAYYHPNRDMAILHFDNEDDNIDVAKLLGVECDLELTDEERLDPASDKTLYFHGHDVEDSPFQDHSINRNRIYTRATGKPTFRTPHQIFCPTNPVLTDGMCGGPVLISEKPTQDNQKIVCGIIEGIVPTDHPTESLRETAVFVESGEIRAFVKAVENYEIQPLIGGYAQRIVASDQDPDKMQLEKVVN